MKPTSTTISEAARAMQKKSAASRWKGKTKAERSAIMRKVMLASPNGQKHLDGK